MGLDRQRDRQPRELGIARRLANTPKPGRPAPPADLPAMLQAAHDYIRDNRTGRTEIWICSDLRENDWTPDSGRWSSLRDALSGIAAGGAVSIAGLSRSRRPGNVAVRVTEVRRQKTGDGAEIAGIAAS